MDGSAAPIKVSVDINPPWANRCCAETLQPSKQCPLPGIACEFLYFCLESLNIRYTITHASDDWNSDHKNGSTLAGPLGVLDSGEADVVASATVLTENRLKNFSFASPVFNLQYVYIVKLLDLTPGDGAMLLLEGFHKYVWLGFLTTLCALIIAWACGETIMNRRSPNWNSFLTFCTNLVNTAWSAVAFVLQQPQQEVRSSRAFTNVFFVLMSTLAVVMVNMYQNVVYNQISTAAINPPFRSTHELVNLIERGTLKLAATSPDIAYFDMVNNSKSAHFKGVRRALKDRPLQIVRWQDAAEVLMKGGYVYVATYHGAVDIVNSTCALEIVYLDTPINWAGFVFKKNSEFTDRIDHAAKQLFSRLEDIEKRTLNAYRRQCSRTELRPIRLSTFGGIFVMYCALVTLGILCFLLENLMKRVICYKAEREKPQEAEVKK